MSVVGKIKVGDPAGGISQAGKAAVEAEIQKLRSRWSLLQESIDRRSHTRPRHRAGRIMRSLVVESDRLSIMIAALQRALLASDRPVSRTPDVPPDDVIGIAAGDVR